MDVMIKRDPERDMLRNRVGQREREIMENNAYTV